MKYLLSEQDRSRWDPAKIQVGITVLDEALALRDPAPYQVQATDWHLIAMLYETLARITPSIVVDVNRAVAVAMAWVLQWGLEMLLRLEEEADGFYPYHAARGPAAPDESALGHCRGLQASTRIVSQQHRTRLSTKAA